MAKKIILSISLAVIIGFALLFSINVIAVGLDEGCYWHCWSSPEGETCHWVCGGTTSSNFPSFR